MQPKPKLRDRRVERTRRLLLDAMRAELGRKAIDQISVNDITEAADINRATFYDHFTDKFDLFNALIADDFRELLERRQICFDGSCAAGISTLILAVGDYLEQIHRDKPACSAGASSGPLIDAAITMAIRRIVLDGLENHGDLTPATREVFASMLGGSVYGAVKQWLSTRQWRVEEAGLLTLVPMIRPLLEHSLPPVEKH